MYPTTRGDSLDSGFREAYTVEESRGLWGSRDLNSDHSFASCVRIARNSLRRSGVVVG